MKQNFSLDLSQMSIEKLENSITNRKMIPSRVLLKENIVDNFQKIKVKEISTVKQLIDKLKSSDKIELFSEQTGISVQYLTLLKREANSYKSKPIKLDTFPGLDEGTLKKLENANLINTKHIFDILNSDNSISNLANQIDLDPTKLEEIVSLSDLSRLYGVGPHFARIIFDSGVKSVKEFKTYTGEQFIKFYEDSTGKRADFTIDDINFSIEIAKMIDQ